MAKEIKCSIDNCKHNEDACSCSRAHLTVSSSVSSITPSETKHTECADFEC